MKRSSIATLSLVAALFSAGCSDDDDTSKSDGTAGAAGTPGSAGAAGTPGGAGAAGTPGSAGSDGNGQAGEGNGGPGTFTLLWKDEFETLDPARWGTASHTFDENEAQFSPDQVVVEDGMLKLKLVAAPQGSDKPYLSGEARTVEEFTYGRFETRARFAKGSGLISSLFTFWDHLPGDWNEIDIEFLGRYEDRLQYNTIYWDASKARRTAEKVDTVGFDPSADFHVYAFEWTPTEVRFYVDGALRHTSKQGIPEFMKLPQKVMMNLWPANVSAWAGAIDPAAVPAESAYDYVAVYSYAP